MPATDTFERSSFGAIGSASNAFAITPSNSAELSNITRALYVGGAGNISLVTKAGNTVTLVGVAAGSILPIRVRQVNATSTTATSIVGLY